MYCPPPGTGGTIRSEAKKVWGPRLSPSSAWRGGHGPPEGNSDIDIRPWSPSTIDTGSNLLGHHLFHDGL